MNAFKILTRINQIVATSQHPKYCGQLEAKIHYCLINTDAASGYSLLYYLNDVIDEECLIAINSLIAAVATRVDCAELAAIYRANMSKK